MKFNNPLFILLFALFSLPLFGMAEFMIKAAQSRAIDAYLQEKPEKVQDIVTHDFDEPAPEDVKKILDEHAQEMYEANLLTNYMRPFCPSWLPHYYIKEDKAERLKGAKRFKAAINTYGLSKMSLPKKHQYISPKETFVIAQKKEYSQEPLDLEDITQVYKLAYVLRWLDSSSYYNFSKTTDGKVTVLDTELDHHKTDSSHTLSSDSLKLHIINKLKTVEKIYTPGALQFLKNEPRKILARRFVNFYLPYCKRKMAKPQNIAPNNHV